MKTRITPWAVVALFVSLLSMVIFGLLFETSGSLNSVLHLFWAITCTASVILPIISKYHRSQANSRGKGIEIFALVISFFNCEFFLMFTTSINGTVCLLIGGFFVILYVKLFNNSTPESGPSIGEDGTTQKVETYYYMEAANGMTVRVPESRLEAWQAEQDRIKSNPSSAKLTDKEQLLVNAIVHDIYDPKDYNNTTKSAPPIAPAHNSKQRYCQMCGGAIDLESKKCTKCGKQYFNLRRILSVYQKPIVLLLILCLVCTNIYLAVTLSSLRRSISAGQSNIVLPHVLPSETSTPPSSATPTEATERFKRLPTPVNGAIIFDPVNEKVAPLSVETTVYDNCYLVLTEHGSKKLVMSFFVRANSSAEVHVPIGNYDIYYAVGESWYGTEHLFGDSTYRAKFDESFLFTKEPDGYSGWTIEMQPVSYGNLESDPINADDFPS